MSEKTLEAQLGEDDWAIIIGNNGNLKGIFIPAGMDEDLVPESIVTIIAQYFGVDFYDEEAETSDGQTIH